ncbi:cation:proton antiporter [Corynebacterium diphtheriae]|nr:cation:proton antiporter [Corynebacterium diphtheriae]CAB0503431.1 cation:proton antiporter [Corynebacterium diphtheriae]
MLLDADPLVSFAWIMGAALLAPLLSYATGKRLPAVVLLICFGLVIGPNVLGLASLDGGVGLIKEIGLGMLFLLAGYEIEPETLRGKEGRTGLATWLMCAVLSFLGAMSIVGFHSSSTAIVLAIALTSTAIGTLLPIMKQHDMLDTPVGRSLLIHGAIGEIAPILAMALLLSSRSTWLTTAVLLAFFLVAAVVAIVPRTVKFFLPRLLRLCRGR